MIRPSRLRSGSARPGPVPVARAGAAALILAAATTSTAVASPVHAQDALPPPDSVMAYLDDLYRAGSSHAVMTMSVERERGTRTLTLESWSKGQDDALVIIREPAREAGTATLLTEEGLWNYAPRADRLIRIPAGLLSDAWMGSHFTNDDLVRESKYREDYETSLSWTERDGERLILASLTPRPDAPVVYTRVDYLVTPDTWIPKRAEYFDEGELVRTMVFSDVERVDGRPIPMRLTLQPAGDDEGRTEVVYDSLAFDVPLQDDLFTRRGLRRIARSGR